MAAGVLAGDFDLVDATLMSLIDFVGEANGAPLGEEEDGGLRHPVLVLYGSKERVFVKSA